MAPASNSAPWVGPAASRWGHYGPTWIALSVAAVIAFGLNPFPLAPGSALAVLAAIAVFALVGWRAMRQHDRRLCEICMTSMPLNPAEVASRHRLRFAVAHVLMAKSVGLAYLAVVVGSDLVLLRGSMVERIVWAIIQSTMVYLVLAYSSHRRFQPWCPQCRGGQGGRDRDGDRGPAPLGNQYR